MTLQEQYNSIKEGKGAKDVFLKHAKKLFPNMVPNHYGFDDSVNILKQRSVITENIWGIATMSNQQPDWFQIFNENVSEEAVNEEEYCQDCQTIYEWIKSFGGKDLLSEKQITSGILLKKAMEGGKITIQEINNNTRKSASGKIFSELPLVQKVMGQNKALNEAKTYTPSSQEVDVKSKSTKVAKEVEVRYDKKYDNADTKKADNVIFDQLIRGVQFEMENPKNTDKTVEEIKNIVLKNLTKDPIWYTKNAMFGVEGLGYKDDAVALKLSKTDQMTPVNKDKVKANVKDGKTENKKGMPKKVEQMTSTAKSSKGVQKMATPGKPKTIKPKN